MTAARRSVGYEPAVGARERLDRFARALQSFSKGGRLDLENLRRLRRRKLQNLA